VIPLTNGQLVAIREALAAGGTRDQAAAAAGIRRSLLDRHLRHGGQLAGLRGGRRWRPRAADPTPAEIAVRAAEVRSRWPLERWLPEARLDADEAGATNATNRRPRVGRGC
jgi:hypothetical protein